MKIVDKKQDNIMFVFDTVKGNIYEIEGQKDKYFICAEWCNDEGYGHSWCFDQNQGEKDGSFHVYYNSVSTSYHRMFINIANGEIYIVPNSHRVREVNAEVHIKN